MRATSARREPLPSIIAVLGIELGVDILETSLSLTVCTKLEAQFATLGGRVAPRARRRGGLDGVPDFQAAARPLYADFL